VQHTCYQGAIHGFNLQPEKFDDGRAALNEAGDRLKAAFAR
jgi:hypothetical protein